MRAIGATYEPVNEGLLMGAMQMAVAIHRDRRGVAVGDAESRNAAFARPEHRFHGFPEAPPEADRDHQILVGEHVNLVLEVSRAADGRFGRESERRQSVGEKPRERRRQINADDQNAPRAVHERRQLHDALPLQARFEDPQILGVPFQPVVDVIGDAPPLPRRRLEDRVRRDLPDEVLAEVCGEVREAFVAEVLDRANDRGGVDVVALRELAR